MIPEQLPEPKSKLKELGWHMIIVGILICFIVIIFYGNQYCFTYKDAAGKELIHECGDKNQLEQKYYTYLHPKKLNLSEIIIPLQNGTNNTK